MKTSSSNHNQEFATAFLRRFAIPLSRGGTIHVGAPVGPEGQRRLLQAVQAGLDVTEAGQELSAVRNQVVSEILFDAGPPALSDDPDSTKLLVALHDALFLLHPAASKSGLMEPRLRQLVGYIVRICLEAQPPRAERSDIMANTAALRASRSLLIASRHSLLHGLFSITRCDTRVSFWAGHRDFTGVAPPKRLLSWQKLRRVVTESSKVNVSAELTGLKGGWGGGLGKLALEALLSASPLTDILCPARPDPPLDMGKQASLLYLPQISRFIVNSFFELGFARIGNPLSAAYLHLLSYAKPHRMPDLRAILQFFSHLHLCNCLFRRSDVPGFGKALPLLQQDRSLRDFYGLFVVLAESWPDLARPSDVAPASVAYQPIASYLAECRNFVGAARLSELRSLCASALGDPRTHPEMNRASSPDVR